ncbi:succinate dehydrogenase cytochrome b subunit [Stackebrandtia soli]|uniref:succinate dehydrogenase cytochrome b subunit n=1 Tax=Stackebrandtia soli TaxID=1892856 RepID=UPI0039EB1981
MVLATKERPSTVVALWRSTIGKKVVMAVTGAVMLGYLVVHMAGNLKVFYGSEEFNSYAAWIRTFGAPLLHAEWFLWLARIVLLVSVILHAVSAYQLSRLDMKARPAKYVKRRAKMSYATRTMRYGGVIVLLFVVWHILDLTTLTVNPLGKAHHPYENLVATFSTWYGNVIYIVAMLAVGLHVRHGFWSAAQTLGLGSARRQRVLRTIANTLAVVLTIGFIAVPVSVMTGLVS